VSSNAVKSIPEDGSFGDGVREVKAFDALKTCVKGLVDSSVTKIPCLFFHQRMSRNHHARLAVFRFKS
jgi:hypothetical protein